jgi:NAD(P)-dependent dehydrogenase (short-subunit alcohol dehydrogenase family)
VNFDGQVVIVTGAGGSPGLGRSYALLLARLGARVVVNDLGVGPDGKGTFAAHPETVVQEIRDLGGTAVVDTHSVATEDGALAVVATALDAYGRVDALINNAGVMRFAQFLELQPDEITRMVDVHLYGTIWMCRAVWPHLLRNGGGRILNTTSGAMLGAGYGSVYGAVKSGIWGLTRTLAFEGTQNGIAVNALSPGAPTMSARLADIPPLSPEAIERRSPDRVAPIAAYLVHPDCPASGKNVVAEEGHLHEVLYRRTDGVRLTAPSVDEVADAWESVVDRTAAQDLADPPESGFWLGPPPGFVPGTGELALGIPGSPS